ncbi:MAG TPA: hypothetical protein VMO26_07190 [Vicinamibacterales bacterium]|nr:hypothetical protein [Vicinamibacterales bacterium]
MDRDAILEFARRDWSRLDEAKTKFWTRRKRDRCVADLLAMGDELRRHARMLRPDWPGADDRASDRAVHDRVAEALRAVPVRSR